MKKSDAQEKTRTPRPSFDNELGRFVERLKEAVGEASVRSFADRCGLSEAVLRSYLRGATFPTLDRLLAIAHASTRQAAWFIASESKPQSHSQPLRLDVEILREAIRLLVWFWELRGQVFDPQRYPELIVEVYDYLQESDGVIDTSNLIDLSKRIEARRLKGESDAARDGEGTEAGADPARRKQG